MEDVNLKSYAGISGNFIGREITIKGQKQYVVEGYISTGSVDLFGEQVTEECMRDMQAQIESGSIKMDLEHETYHEDNYDIIPIARIMESKVDKKGLWVKALLNSATSRFKEIWSSIKGGFLDAFSIQFVPQEAVIKGDVKVLNKVKLINVGITGTPVNPEARMENVMVKAIRDMELKANPASKYVPKPGESDDDDEAEIKAAKTLLIGRGYKITDPLEVEKINPEDFKRQVKAKYIERTGSSGNYKYKYKQDGKERAKYNTNMSDKDMNDIVSVVESIENEEKGAGRSFNNLDTAVRDTLIDVYTNDGKDVAKLEKLEAAGVKLEGKYKEKLEDSKNVQEAYEKGYSKEESEIYSDAKQSGKDGDKAVQTYREDRKADKEHQAEKEKQASKVEDLLWDKFMEEEGSKFKTPGQAATAFYRKYKNVSTEEMSKLVEKKALSTTSGGLTGHESQSTPNGDDNKKMAEETTVAPEAPVETTGPTPEPQPEPAAEPAPETPAPAEESVDNSEIEAEVKALKKENAALKASVAKIEKQLEAPELKALQEALPQKLNEGATPLSLIG